jgi:O-6-methylguanine DNA methyltransferase
MTFSQGDLRRTLRKIPKGKIVTYADIASALGSPNAPRAAGNLLNKNPAPDDFPCYKVVRSDGKVGGYALGTDEKIRRLRTDGIDVQNERIMDFEEKRFSFL